MQLDTLLNPLVLIPTGIIVILDILSTPLFFYWIKSGEAIKSKYLLLFKPFGTLIGIYFMFTQFGAGFFFGAIYYGISPIIAGIIFFVALVMAVKFKKELGFPHKNYIVNLSVGLVMVFSITIPSIVYSPIKEKCAASNSAKIPTISRAMEKYFAENGKYPEQLDELVPSYVSSIPTPSCSFLFGVASQFNFRARVCKGNEPIIFVKTIDGMGFDLYNFKNGAHSRIHSFLDNPNPGYCP